jgi:membrane complex biogenesis BtpA family protein
MTRIALALPRRDALVGANVLRNDARGALAVAVGADLDFVRVNVHTGAAVTDQGVIEGRAAETMREREALAPGVAILADVDVKHATPLGAGRDLAETARDTAYRGLADGLIVTGKATGSAASREDLEIVTRAVPDRPVFVGSGVTADTVEATLKLAAGVIAGTALKTGKATEARVDGSRAREFARAARR